MGRGGDQAARLALVPVQERRSCCPPIFFDRKAGDGSFACAGGLLALLKEPCLQCLGLGLLVMAQGRNGIDQFGHPIRPQADSAAPTGSMSLRLVGLGSFTLCLVSNAAGLFRLLGCRKVSRSAFRSEEHTSELQSLMRISYAVFCLKKKKKN